MAVSCENGINFRVAYNSVSLFGSWASISFSGGTLLYSLGSLDDFLIPRTGTTLKMLQEPVRTVRTQSILLTAKSFSLSQADCNFVGPVNHVSKLQIQQQLNVALA